MGDTPSDTRHGLRALGVWLIVTVIVVVAWILIDPHLISWGVLPPAASARAVDIDQVIFLFTLISLPVFTLVVVYGFYSARAFRSRGQPTDGPARLVSPRFSPIWLGVSIVLVIFLYVYGLNFMGVIDARANAGDLQVTVTGEQWLWNYTYPTYGFAGSTELVLPVNQQVDFTIESIDVQHSFWIPALGIKEDAVPGEQNHISITPKVLGDYVVRCAELCGLYHAYMETPVHVVSQADFNAWVAKQQPAQPSSVLGMRMPVPVLPAIAFVGVVRHEIAAAEGRASA